MAEAKSGDRVRVHYTGKLSDGAVFDSSEGREPLEFEVGAGDVIKGFEDAVVGLNIGDSVTVEIPSDQAYGPYRQELAMEVDKKSFPPDVDPQPGQRFQIPQPNGQAVVVTITEVKEDSVTMDANHALAGKDLTFDIKLVEIV